MKFDLKALDGTGRQARPKQLEALAWLSANWSGAPVLAMQLPTGVGKSFLARVIQRATGGRIVVPSNLLMGQYTATYPEVNSLKGRTHYACREGFGSCDDRKSLGMKPCPECPYRAARRAAGEGVPTIFNPMSMFYLDRDPSTTPPSVLIVDEAHSLIDMLKALASKRFPVDKWGKPDSLDQIDVEAWLERQARAVRHLMDKAAKTDIKAFIRHRSELDSIELVLESYRAEPEHYVITREQDKYRGKDSESTYLRPIFPPPTLVRQLLRASKVVLMSATLLETDVKLLAAGRRYLRLDSRSPIDKARRPLVYAPLGQRVNYRTPPEALAKHALGLLVRHPGENSIIHATYELAAKLAPLLRAEIPGLITHTPETKEAQLEAFKKQGGVFLASGCAEGVDLPGDLCRVNIILSLQRGNPSSPEVKLRLALPGGRDEYELEALKTVIQQTGRSTRGESDKSTSYICDPQFPEYYLKQKTKLPISFCEAIVWKLPTKAGR